MSRTSRRNQRAEQRVRPGDGRALPPFRWWQTLGRSLLAIDVPTDAGANVEYAVDVRQLGDGSDGAVRARLYRNGTQTAVARMPARFAVEGGSIEVAMGGFGLTRCHFIPTASAAERVLTPHPASAEGRQASFDANHPQLSRVVGVVATLAVMVGVAVGVLHLVEPMTMIPFVRDLVGGVRSPLQTPLAVTVAVGVLAFLGSLQRALRMRSSWIDTFAS